MFKFEKINKKLIFILALTVGGLLILLFFSHSIIAKKKNINLRLELKKTQEEFTQKKEALSAQVEDLSSQKKDLQEKLEKSEASRKEIETELINAKGVIDELRTQLSAAEKSAAGAFEKSMQETRKTELILLAKIDELNKENLQLQNKLFKLTTLTKDVGATIAKGKNSELKETGTKSKAENSLVGRILKLDPKYSFAIFNLGQDHGIEVGTIGEIYRNNLKISEVVVKETYPNMSFGLIIREKTIKRVHINDQVVFGLTAP